MEVTTFDSSSALRGFIHARLKAFCASLLCSDCSAVWLSCKRKCLRVMNNFKVVMESNQTPLLQHVIDGATGATLLDVADIMLSVAFFWFFFTLQADMTTQEIFPGRFQGCSTPEFGRQWAFTLPLMQGSTWNIRVCCSVQMGLLLFNYLFFTILPFHPYRFIVSIEKYSDIDVEPGLSLYNKFI